MKRNITVFLLVLSLFISGSCSLLKKTEEEKATIEQKEAEQSFQKDIEKREVAHYKMQTKETKKMMKRIKRASKKLNEPRRLLR